MANSWGVRLSAPRMNADDHPTSSQPCKLHPWSRDRVAHQWILSNIKSTARVSCVRVSASPPRPRRSSCGHSPWWIARNSDVSGRQRRLFGQRLLVKQATFHDSRSGRTHLHLISFVTRRLITQYMRATLLLLPSAPRGGRAASYLREAREEGVSAWSLAGDAMLCLANRWWACGTRYDRCIRDVPPHPSRLQDDAREVVTPL